MADIKAEGNDAGRFFCGPRISHNIAKEWRRWRGWNLPLAWSCGVSLTKRSTPSCIQSRGSGAPQAKKAWRGENILWQNALEHHRGEWRITYTVSVLLSCNRRITGFHWPVTRGQGFLRDSFLLLSRYPMHYRSHVSGRWALTEFSPELNSVAGSFPGDETLQWLAEAWKGRLPVASMIFCRKFALGRSWMWISLE